MVSEHKAEPDEPGSNDHVSSDPRPDGPHRRTVEPGVAVVAGGRDEDRDRPIATRLTNTVQQIGQSTQAPDSRRYGAIPSADGRPESAPGWHAGIGCP